MRKVLSLILAAIMLLSAFMLTSCDLVESVKGFVDDLFGTEEAEPITTITATEWAKALDVTNYTIKAKIGNYTYHYVVDDVYVKIEESKSGLNMVIYYDYEVGCLVIEGENGFVGYQTRSFPFDELSLEKTGFISNIRYKDLVYNEETKSYNYEYAGVIYEFCFENAKLVYASIEQGTNQIIEFIDIGTSSVEIGEYDLITDGIPTPSDAPEGTVTTVTDAQILDNLAINNCTVKYSFNSYGVIIEMVIKITEDGAHMSAEFLGDVMNEYLVNIGGNYYDLVLGDDGNYYVYPDEKNVTDITTGVLGSIEELGLDLDSFKYNEEGRYYSLDSDVGKFFFYFENGRIVKIIFARKSDDTIAPYIEMPLVFSDFGTTKFIIPEYTIGEKELEYKLNGDGTGYIVTGMGTYENYKESEIIIPDTYRGLPVVGIDDRAFNNNELINKVVISDNVQEISQFAFYGCKNLKTVEIGNGVEHIGSTAFGECSALESITLGTSLTAIDDCAFAYCSNLKTIIIPSGVTTIKFSAFLSCWDLTIYCEAESQPEEWSPTWNIDSLPVVWGYTGE